MAYGYGEFRFGEHRYSWLSDWEAEVCEPLAWDGLVCTVSPWVTIDKPGSVWQSSAAPASPPWVTPPTTPNQGIEWKPA
jgi:hypothetical protein